ncbi:MAG: hypothetical protein BYD32DRAFT_403786 [Podila humilis]|nr:MAG: hypothetical protein BYD32DRAFT_403786 [Podila humilis]
MAFTHLEGSKSVTGSVEGESGPREKERLSSSPTLTTCSCFLPFSPLQSSLVHPSIHPSTHPLPTLQLLTGAHLLPPS